MADSESDSLWSDQGEDVTQQEVGADGDTMEAQVAIIAKWILT